MTPASSVHFRHPGGKEDSQESREKVPGNWTYDVSADIFTGTNCELA